MRNLSEDRAAYAIPGKRWRGALKQSVAIIKRRVGCEQEKHLKQCLFSCGWMKNRLAKQA